MIEICAIYFKTSSSTGWMMAGSATSIELIIWNFWMILRILNGLFTTRWQHLLVLYNLQILSLLSVRMVTMNFIRSANIVMSVASVRKIVQVLIIYTVSLVGVLPISCFPTLKHLFYLLPHRWHFLQSGKGFLSWLIPSSETIRGVFSEFSHSLLNPINLTIKISHHIW